MNPTPLRIRHSHIKPIALAIALALPGAAALAQPSNEGVVTEVKQHSANAWDKTKEYSANAWDKTKAFFAPKPGAANPSEPQRYGRAGGYVGADEIKFLNSSVAPTTSGQAADTVKSGNAQIDRDAAVNHDSAMTSHATTGADTTSGATSSATPEQHNGRTAGGRFDNPEGARGQNENGG